MECTISLIHIGAIGESTNTGDPSFSWMGIESNFRLSSIYKNDPVQNSIVERSGHLSFSKTWVIDDRWQRPALSFKETSLYRE